MSADVSERFSEIQKEVYRHGYEKGRADAIEKFKTDMLNKINFEDNWLFARKSNNRNTDLMFSALRTFVKTRAEQLKEQE